MSISLPKSPEEIIPPKKLTRFERARIIGARALQLSMGAPPFIDVSNLPKDPIIIAEKELEMGVLPLTIVRWLRGEVKQLIPVKWLIEEEKKEYYLIKQ
ncbi:DNA-directed RNA polymerase subunit K [Fervidicoccus fontis]|uniref:DNA-directed RNA polymerase subunit Rpo6 n=2 Tax=Fervidicoccus fontis TaxID=683846 RepID=I0A1X4_FERFK|nr:DNA-directed RNA polymerase subunit K [Fervidicoccus fontis]AFH42981.1 DNA-directed RNA polymerase subunit K [Fervidicoccus fontis Kam940]MBE9391463.1 DNA-directed RNA polymerase subunit K [Fervidicoccus fontis]